MAPGVVSVRVHLRLFLGSLFPCNTIYHQATNHLPVGLLLTTVTGHDGLVLVVVVVLVLIKVLLSIIRFVGHLACHSDTKDEFSENKTLNQILSLGCMLCCT